MDIFSIFKSTKAVFEILESGSVMLPLLRTKKVMMTSSYWFKQGLWLLLGH